MKRNLPFLFCALLLLAALPWPAVGQDNPYGIDDLCYQLFQQAEATVGTPEFEAVNADLLASAIAKKDEQAARPGDGTDPGDAQHGAAGAR